MQKTHALQEVPPAFQMYASNMLTNPRFQEMDSSERGIFFSLYLNCWTAGRLPANLDQLSLRIGLMLKNQLSKNIMSFFDCDGEWITCPSLEKYKIELLHKRKCKSEGGKAAMKQRWGKEAHEYEDIIPMKKEVL